MCIYYKERIVLHDLERVINDSYFRRPHAFPACEDSRNNSTQSDFDSTYCGVSTTYFDGSVGFGEDLLEWMVLTLQWRDFRQRLWQCRYRIRRILLRRAILLLSCNSFCMKSNRDCMWHRPRHSKTENRDKKTKLG